MLSSALHEGMYAKKGSGDMRKEPCDVAKDALNAAQSNDIQQCLIELSTVVEGIAEYQWSINHYLKEITRNMNIS